MWNFDPNQYEEKEGFTIIPVGDHRVRINDVISKKSKNTGNDMFEIVLDVSGHSSKLWYYLVLDPADPKKTNQRIGDFFNSFGITSPAMGSGKQWIGTVGAVRVKHEEYNGENRAKVAYCLARNRQDKLAPWKNMATTAAPTPTVESISIPDDLPF